MADLNDLKDYIAARSERGAAVAFSGGVDSSVLLAAVAAYRRESEEFFPFLAFYAQSDFQAGEDVSSLKQFAGEAGAEFVCFPFDPLKNVPELADNPPDRCYFCKKFFFSEFQRAAQARGIEFLADGTNADDLTAYRPGRRALAELDVLSPFAELGIAKVQIRELARSLHLPCAEKPAAPCLATRFEYGTHLTLTGLKRVASGEAFLRTLLPPEANLRLRVHQNDFARIECDPAAIPLLAAHAPEIKNRLQKLGFSRVTLDLAGFRSGSMDENLTHKR